MPRSVPNQCGWSNEATGVAFEDRTCDIVVIASSQQHRTRFVIPNRSHRFSNHHTGEEALPCSFSPVSKIATLPLWHPTASYCLTVRTEHSTQKFHCRLPANSLSARIAVPDIHFATEPPVASKCSVDGMR